MKRYTTFVLTICCLLLLCIKAYSQKRISLDGTLQEKTISYEVIESNASIYKVKVNIHGLYDNIIENEQGLFHLLILDGCNNLMEIGNPSLPYYTQLIAIPPGSEIKATVIEEKWTETEVGTIYPAQSPIYEEQHTKGFNKNENIYKSVFTPEVVTIGKERVWKGIRNVGVFVCPFKYYPSENRLSVLSSFILQVSFQGQDASTLQEETSNYGLFNNKVYRELSSAQIKNNKNSSGDYDYLIIIENTSNTNNLVFQESLKNFRMWKALKGYKTRVVPINTIGTYASDIRDTIIQERSKGVEYVLLVGDANQIPLSSVSCSYGSSYVKGDYWYGCDSYEDLADIPIGRFSISSTPDFVNMIKKTIRYENTYDCHGNALFVSHWEGYSSYLSYQWYCESIRNGIYTTPLYSHTAYGGEDATNADVIAHINHGDHIINYRGHAEANCWGDGAFPPYTWNTEGESFESSQINNMGDNTCCVFFCIACNTGNVEYSTDCMLETFTRSTHGAAAYIGSTYNSETSANDHYDEYLFQKLLNDGVSNIGKLNILAHYNNVMLFYPNSSYADVARDNAYSYICGGDPSLELWTSVPNSISNVSLTCNNGYISVNTGLSGNYYIAIASEDGELLSRIDCSTPTCSFPIPADKFYFAVNKHNYRPYVIYYDTVSDCIRNVIFNYDAYYENTSMPAGDGFTINVPDGEVLVKSGHKLIIKNRTGGVYIDSGFDCEKGSVFEVK